jgi:hypothetical protein
MQKAMQKGQTGRVFQLEAPHHSGSVRFLSGLTVALAEGQRTSVVTLTRTGSFTDPRYGRFEISREMLLQMVENFRRNTYGQDIFLDVAHQPSNGAAAKVLELSVEGNRLRARVEWTDYGLEAVRTKGYRYLSAEFVENYTDNEAGGSHGALLLGAGLTIRPVIKRLDPIQLTESDHPTLLHPELTKTLTDEALNSMKDHLKKLRAHLEGLKRLSADAINTLLGAFESAAKTLGEDDAAIQALAEQFQATGKQLAEQLGDQPVRLEIQMPPAASAGARALSEDDVKRILSEAQQAQQQQARNQQETLAGHHAAFDRVLSEAKGLDDATRKELADARELLTANMSADQVRRLAEHQVAQGNRLMAARQLAAMGYGAPVGDVRIIAGQDHGAKKLQESIDQHLRGSLAFANHTIRVPEKTSAFVERVLAEFDRTHARQLHEEARALSGETNISHTALPLGFQRTVIREALHDLNILNVVQTLTDPTATATTQIPYEQRDTSEIQNDGIVYEGQGIPRAGVRQHMDLAYVLAMKLSLKLSNEVMHFTRASQINWDAYARNVESNARVMRELVSRRIANEVQRSADAYLAVTVTAENVGAQLDGTKSIIKTAEFPIVRPHQVRDLQGNAVGSPTHPITVVVNSVTLQPYDGTGTQANGTYYRVLNYNLGYIQLVNQAGAPVTPDTTGTVTYSYATNIVKFSTDIPGGSTLEKHLNGLLRAIGARKAVLASQRYIQPNFALMSPILNDMVSNAEQFIVSLKRDGSDTGNDGDLERVKGIPAWGTNAPGIDLGDERILLGQRGTTTYTIAKPFTTGTPFEAVDSNGRPTGEKVAYGEEYNAIHTPLPIRDRYTSVLVYSATNR